MPNQVQFTLSSVLVVMTAVAILVASDLLGIAVVFLLLAVLPAFALQTLIRLFRRARMSLANRLAPFCYSCGLFWVLVWGCGRTLSAWGLCNHGGRLAAKGQIEAALDVYSMVLRIDGSRADYWVCRGAVHYSCGNLDNASRDMSQALSIDPENELAYIYRGYVRLAHGDLAGAVEDLAEVYCDSSKHYMVAVSRGHAQEGLGNWSEAIGEYLLASRLDPCQTAAGISLARLQAACPEDHIRNGRKSLENARRMCVRTQWKDWVAVSVYAAGHAELGDFESAVTYARMAYELAPDDEKLERMRRIEQYQQRIPFRIKWIDHDPSIR